MQVQWGTTPLIPPRKWELATAQVRFPVILLSSQKRYEPPVQECHLCRSFRGKEAILSARYSRPSLYVIRLSCTTQASLWPFAHSFQRIVNPFSIFNFVLSAYICINFQSRQSYQTRVRNVQCKKAQHIVVEMYCKKCDLREISKRNANSFIT